MEIKKHIIYLDYAAATPMDSELVSVMQPYAQELFYNPSAPYNAARRVRADVDDARARIAACIGARAQNIVFTAGATEATNLAFTALSADGRVVSSAIEHDSVLSCVTSLDYTLVPVDSVGIIDLKAIQRTITPKTELVSVALVNGELGTIQPIRDIALICESERERRLAAGEKRPLYLHTDASQAASLLSVNVSTLGVDMMTLSAAKIYGPKQVGLLWAKDGIVLHPLVKGGGQEAGLRSGTENVAGIIGFAKALELAVENRDTEYKRLETLRTRLVSHLCEELPFMCVLGPTNIKRRLPSIVSLSFPGLLGRRLVIGLDSAGVLVGTGSACAASKMRISHVLKAIGASDEVAEATLRISFGRQTTEEDITVASQIIVEVIRKEAARKGII